MNTKVASMLWDKAMNAEVGYIEQGLQDMGYSVRQTAEGRTVLEKSHGDRSNFDRIILGTDEAIRIFFYRELMKRTTIEDEEEIINETIVPVEKTQAKHLMEGANHSNEQPMFTYSDTCASVMI